MLWGVFAILNVYYFINITIKTLDPEASYHLYLVQEEKERLTVDNSNLRAELADARSLRVIRQKAKAMGMKENAPVLFLSNDRPRDADSHHNSNNTDSRNWLRKLLNI